MRLALCIAASLGLAGAAGAQTADGREAIEAGQPPGPDLGEYRDTATDNTVGAGLDHDVRGGAFDETWIPDTAELPAKAAQARAAQIDADVEYRARQEHERGVYVYLEEDGWVWVPNGARLSADGAVSTAAARR